MRPSRILSRNHPTPCVRTHHYLALAVALLLRIGAAAQTDYPAVLFDGTGTSPEEKLVAMTLAGIVNRDSARLYLLNVYETWSFGRTDETWRDLYQQRGGVRFDSLASLQALIQRFRPFLRGAITYDSARTWGNFPGQTFRWQGEVAASLGGLTDRLPLSPTAASMLELGVSDSVLVEDHFDGDAPVWVPGRLELAFHPWNNTLLTEENRYLTLLNWGVTNLLPRANPECFYIREITDWAVQRRMFQVNLAGTDALDMNSMPAARADVLERILNHLHAKNPASIFHIYGWIYPEPMTQWFATFGASVHETLLGNLSWHAAFPTAPRAFTPPSRVDPDTVPLEQKHYVLFVSSEGDASNWVMSFQSGAWLSPARGSVPMAWGWNLHLLDQFPFVAAYYFDTATPNDGFIAVTSPLGYAYPDLWGSDVWNGALDSTRALMDRYGVSDMYGYKHYAPTGTMVYRGKTISNSFDFQRYASFQSGAGADLTILYDPLLPSQIPLTDYGPLLFNHTGDGSFYGNASDLTAMADRIITKTRTQPLPSFLMAGYQRFRQDDFTARPSPASSDISMPRLSQVAQLILADPIVGPSVEFVTPERFSVLMRRHVGYLAVENARELPDLPTIGQNFPNPFNPTTTIRFRVVFQDQTRGNGSHVNAHDTTVKIYDLLGREVAVLADGELPAGTYEVTWDADREPSGMYVARLQSGSFTASRTMLLLK